MKQQKEESEKVEVKEKAAISETPKETPIESKQESQEHEVPEQAALLETSVQEVPEEAATLEQKKTEEYITDSTDAAKLESVESSGGQPTITEETPVLAAALEEVQKTTEVDQSEEKVEQPKIIVPEKAAFPEQTPQQQDVENKQEDTPNMEKEDEMHQERIESESVEKAATQQTDSSEIRDAASEIAHLAIDEAVIEASKTSKGVETTEIEEEQVRSVSVDLTFSRESERIVSDVIVAEVGYDEDGECFIIRFFYNFLFLECSTIADTITSLSSSPLYTTPVFTGRLPSSACFSHDKLMLEVMFSGVPQPTISWLLDDHELISDGFALK